MDVLIVVPTYDERDNIEPLLEGIHLHVPDAHVLFVDDASPDGTGAVIDEIAARDARVHALHRKGKLGLGTAYLDGFRWGMVRRYDLLFEMDADLSHDPAHLPAFLEAIEDADIVLGSRYIDGGGTENWERWREGLSRGGNLYARTLLGLSQRDLTGGFKCFRRSALSQMPLHKVRSEGYAFQVELTWRATLAGLKIREVPIVFRERRRGQSKLSRRIVAEALLTMIRLRREGPDR